MKLPCILTVGMLFVSMLSVPAWSQVGDPNIWQGGIGTWDSNMWSLGSSADGSDQAIVITDEDNLTVDQSWGTPTANLVGALRMEGNVTVNVVSSLTTDGRVGSTSLSGGNWNFAIGGGATFTGSGNSTHTGPAFLGNAIFSGSGMSEFQGDVTIGSNTSNSLTIDRIVSTTVGTTTTWTASSSGGDMNLVADWTNQGSFNRNQNDVSGKLILGGPGKFTNSASGTFNVTGNNTFVLDGGGTFENNGIVNIDGGQVDATAVLFNIQQGSSLNLFNGGQFAGDATFDAATLSGSGDFTGTAVVQNGGSLSPGNSPGTLTVNGDLTIDASTVTIELGGTNPGEYDLLNVTGVVTLLNTPTIAIDFFGTYDGTTAMVGDTFTFFTAGSGLDSGAIAFDFSNSGGASAWTTNVTSTSISITYVPEPNALAFMGIGWISWVTRRRRS